MTTPSPRSPASLPASSDLAIDQACNAFEDAWKAGLQPFIENYLARVSELARPALLRELVAIELQYRWSAAETLSPQSYLRRFPALDPDWLASLAAAPGASLRLERTAASEPGTLTQASSEALTGRRVVFPTKVLGDYELLEEISHGGMGVVYRARQVSLNRIVAVKLIRSGHLASDDEFQRFQFEAEAAANLDHPHIVPVYEVGAENGLRYLAMKLIEGGNLSQRMSDFTLAEVDQRTLAESADRGSGKEESAARQMVMARLLVSVARAVHYAHQRGILHRDLKPSNILLGRDNAPFVSDFGLAKRVDAMNSDEQEQLTRTGVIVGTPSYMSPEQARGVKALTTAADVYALGAILYHLITGEAPFRAPTALDIIHKVITEEVRPPRQLQPRVAVDLETICLKCLRKDPPARYSSAEELARDLERFERGEPILARPVSAWEKSWRWMRRNRAVASLILAIAGLLLVAVVFSTALAVWALAEKSRADDTAMDERAARGLAESNLTLAERAVEDFLDKIEEHPRLREADFLDLRRELLASALPFYEEIVQQKPGDANLELKRGRAYARLGFLHSALGKKQNAVEDYRKSQALIRSQAEAAPAELEHRHQLARSHNELGAILRDLSRREEAEREFLQALKLSTALVEADGTNPKHRLELSHANGNLAVLLRDWGKPAEAEPLRRRSLEMLEKLAADHPGYSQYTLGLVMACNNLGGLLRDLGRLEDAVQEFQRAQKTCEPVLATTPDSVGFRHELARSYRFQGVVLSDLHRREEAERAYRQSIPHYKRLADNFPSSPHYRHELSMSHNSLGLLLQGLQRPQEAETQYRAAIAFQQLLVDSFPDSPAYRQSLARSRHNLGNVLVERGQRAEGEKEIRLALGLHKQLMEQESALPEHKSSYASTLHDLARCFKEREEFGEARRLFEQAVQFQRQAYHTAPKHPIYGRFLVKHTWELAHVKLELGAHQQTADTAAELILIRPEDGGDAASAAELTAWCITAVGKDRQLTAEAQRERAADYAARSMALLTDAVRRGYTNVESLNRSKAFAPMRDRPDFKKLLEDLEARRKTAPR